MWEWFDEGAATGSEADTFKMISEFMNANQMDPVEVSDRIVELVEAEETTQNNFVPAELEALAKG